MTEKSDVTLNEFDELCEKAYQLQSEVDELEQARLAKFHELGQVKNTILGILKDRGHEKYQSRNGLVSVRKRFTVSAPKDPESRAQFFRHLESKGIFLDMATVNHATLNAYYREEMAAAEASGDLNFQIPGLGAPQLSEQIVLLKGKS